jgi:hypothetical protein
VFRLLILPSALACLVASAAAAETASGVPDDYVSVLKVGRISVFSASRTAIPAELQGRLQKALKSLQDRYTAQYGLDKEVYKPGTLSTLAEPPETVDFVVFPDLAAYREWCGVKGAADVTAHAGRHSNVIGIPLEEGDISADSWWVLAHEFSHVFFAHTLRLGGPAWLNEGLAEYFASTSRLYDGPKHSIFKKMLLDLESRRSTKEANKIGDLIRMPAAEFGRQEFDEAWVLAHLLVTECSTQLNDLVSATRSLELDAFENLEAVNADLRSFSAGLLEQAFGGPRTLQAAFDAHLDELLKNPSDPAKLKTRPGGLVWSPPGIEIEAKVVGTDRQVKDDDGTVYNSRASSGTLRYRAPWPAEVRATAAVGDDRGIWGEELLLLKEDSMKAGDKTGWNDELIPKLKKAKLFRVTVEWKVKDGGTYRTVKVFPFK